MWGQLTASFLTGLCLGPACLVHCGAFQAAFVARWSGTGRHSGMWLGGTILIGRLCAYLGLGFIIGLVACEGLPLPRRWVVNAIIGLLLLVFAGSSSGHVNGCGCGRISRHAGGSAFALGFLSGLAPCPPLLASGLLALHAHGIGFSVATFAAFFLGSTLCLFPFLAGAAAVGPSLHRRMKSAGRILAAAMGVCALGLAAREFPLPAGEPPPSVLAAATVPVPIIPDQDRPREASEPAVQAKAPVPAKAPAGIEPLYRKQSPVQRVTEAFVKTHRLSLHEARFYQRLDNGDVQCGLCPRRCLLHNGERGKCGIRANLDGTLRALTYSRPVSLTPDPVEKKPLYHVLPGSTALSLATVGCNSGCVFCQNYQISQALPEDVRHLFVPPEQLVDLARKRGDKGIAFTYTEPTVFFEYMLDTARLAKEQGIRSYWITCGQINEAPLLELCKYLDAANVDLKGFSEGFYREYCDFEIQPVLQTLKVLVAQGVWVEITNLLIPGANDDPGMIRDMCRWIAIELGPEVPLHFSRFHPDFKLLKRPATPATTLVMARNIALESGLKHVYIGNVRVEGAGDTICPNCGKCVIKRSGFLVVENHLREGCCPFCGHPVHGCW